MKKIFKNKVFLAGFILLIIGSGPLLVTLLLAEIGLITDTNPNPVILGMMARFSFWPGLILMGIGAYKAKTSDTKFTRR